MERVFRLYNQFSACVVGVRLEQGAKRYERDARVLVYSRGSPSQGCRLENKTGNGG